MKIGESTDMSHRIGNIVVLRSGADTEGVCELCGKFADLRPYGPRGEKICFECGEKNPGATERQMNRVLYGESTH